MESFGYKKLLTIFNCYDLFRFLVCALNTIQYNWLTSTDILWYPLIIILIDVLLYLDILGYLGIPWYPLISADNSHRLDGWSRPDILRYLGITGYPWISLDILKSKHPWISWYSLIHVRCPLKYICRQHSSFLTQPNEVKHFDKANFWHRHATKIRNTILEMPE